MEKPSINILCIGDSLTAGHIGYRQYSPYTEPLKALLLDNPAFNNHTISITNAGVDGETTDEILPRLSTQLQENRFDYVVLLAGTNDIGWISSEDTTIPAEDAISHITFEPMYTLLTNSESVKGFIQLTVPYNSSDRRSAFYKANKDALNHRITQNPCPKKSVLDLNDPALNFNYFFLSEQDQDKYWLWDNLHYSVDGYTRIAECIYPALVKMIDLE
ncbi:hypothetical protein BGZ76_006042 [Entomortierella beljakovae]|nr:hypothetical protein BGZ76_006042 [Entomortierella beljakovae]